MDVTVTTSDPAHVAADDVRDALERAGYYVGSVTIIRR